ncbi:MAG TPA: OmpA family protein [Nevskiaceae bacterium]|nr:OmpA family protein [Nevskiaceae bacterium]
MNKLVRAGSCLALAFAAFSASAADKEMRPYLDFGYSHVFSDSDRKTNDGNGAYVGVGKAINDFWGWEFSGYYNNYSGDSSNPVSGREYGGKLDGMFFYSRKPSFSPYLAVGVGGLRTDKKNAPSASSTDPTVDAGLGFTSFFPVTSTFDLGLRADLRYRWLDLKDIPGAGSVSEPVLRVGLVIPMGTGAVAGAVAANAASALGPHISTGHITANDQDGDGVLDDVDQCPNTPAGWLVDARGCPIDSDHDGVPDNLDKCPGTPPGISVDATGCPISVAAAGANRSFENTNFAFDKSDLTDYAKAILDNAANVINGLVQKYPSLKVDVSGHTDYIGTEAYNMGLSERRANAVKGYLTRKGVDANRINTFSYGETKPIAPNETSEGRALNRRAEIRTHE